MTDLCSRLVARCGIGRAPPTRTTPSQTQTYEIEDPFAYAVAIDAAIDAGTRNASTV